MIIPTDGPEERILARSKSMDNEAPMEDSSPKPSSSTLTRTEWTEGEWVIDEAAYYSNTMQEVVQRAMANGPDLFKEEDIWAKQETVLGRVVPEPIVSIRTLFQAKEQANKKKTLKEALPAPELLKKMYVAGTKSIKPGELVWKVDGAYQNFPPDNNWFIPPYGAMNALGTILIGGPNGDFGKPKYGLTMKGLEEAYRSVVPTIDSPVVSTYRITLAEILDLAQCGVRFDPENEHRWGIIRTETRYNITIWIIKVELYDLLNSQRRAFEPLLGTGKPADTNKITDQSSLPEKRGFRSITLE